MTTSGGAISYGTENVILYCLCVVNNVATGPTRWFFNGSRISLSEDDGSGSPFARDSVPSALIIPSFITGRDGTYSCGPNNNFNRVLSQGDSITLTLLGMYPCIICCVLL